MSIDEPWKGVPKTLGEAWGTGAPQAYIPAPDPIAEARRKADEAYAAGLAEDFRKQKERAAAEKRAREAEWRVCAAPAPSPPLEPEQSPPPEPEAPLSIPLQVQPAAAPDARPSPAAAARPPARAEFAECSLPVSAPEPRRPAVQVPTKTDPAADAVAGVIRKADAAHAAALAEAAAKARPEASDLDHDLPRAVTAPGEAAPADSAVSLRIVSIADPNTVEVVPIGAQGDMAEACVVLHPDQVELVPNGTDDGADQARAGMLETRAVDPRAEPADAGRKQGGRRRRRPPEGKGPGVPALAGGKRSKVAVGTRAESRNGAEPSEVAASTASAPVPSWMGSTRGLRLKLALIDAMTLSRVLNDSERRVGERLLAYLNEGRGCAWPGVTRLARELGLDARTVERAESGLVAKHFFLKKASSGGRGRSAEYFPLFPAAPGSALRGGDTPAGASQDSTRNGETARHGCRGFEAEKPRQSRPETPAIASRNPGTAAPPLLKSTSEETSGGMGAKATAAERGGLRPEERATPEQWRKLREAMALLKKERMQGNEPVSGS